MDKGSPEAIAAIEELLACMNDFADAIFHEDVKTSFVIYLNMIAHYTDKNMKKIFKDILEVMDDVTDNYIDLREKIDNNQVH